MLTQSEREWCSQHSILETLPLRLQRESACTHLPPDDFFADELISAFNSCPNLIVLGIGKGQWLEKVLAFFKQGTNHFLGVLEPKIGAIRAFLQSKYALECLEQPQLAIFPTPEPSCSFNSEFDPSQKELDLFAKLFCQGDFKILVHPGYRHAPFAEDFKQRLSQLIDDYRGICREKLFGPDKMGHCLLNYPYLRSSAFHSGVRLNPSIPIVLCGAGPSLVGQLEYLNQWRGQAYVVSCGTATMVLDSHGIEPDWIAGVCPYSAHNERFRRNSFIESPLLTCLHVHPGVLEVSSDKRFIIAGLGGAPTVRFLEKQIKAPGASSSDYGVSVLTAAFKAFYEMGARKFIFVGADLCYQDGAKYAKGADPISMTKLIAKDISQELALVSNCQGREVTSNHVWLFEKHWIERFIKQHEGVIVYQCSLEGLSIEGAFHSPLQDAIQRLTSDTSYHDLSSELWIQYNINKHPSDLDMPAMYGSLAESFDAVRDLCSEVIERLEALLQKPVEEEYALVMQEYYEGLKQQICFQGFCCGIDWAIRALQEMQLWHQLRRASTRTQEATLLALIALDAERVVVMYKRIGQLTVIIDQVAQREGWWPSSC